MASAFPDDEEIAKHIRRQEIDEENERFETMNQAYWHNNIWKPMMKKEEGGEKKKEEEEKKKKKEEEKKMSPEDRYDFDVERARCLMERKQLLRTQAARQEKWKKEKGYSMPTELDQEKEEKKKEEERAPPVPLAMAFIPPRASRTPLIHRPPFLGKKFTYSTLVIQRDVESGRRQVFLKSDYLAKQMKEILLGLQEEEEEEKEEEEAAAKSLSDVADLIHTLKREEEKQKEEQVEFVGLEDLEENQEEDFPLLEDRKKKTRKHVLFQTGLLRQTYD